jgi:hypothetical protein
MPLARSAGKAVFGDVLGGILNAPVFWYTRGAIDALKYCSRLIVRRWKTLALGVWIGNIFVPMYGQRDVAGTLISFFMRLIQIIARGIVMILWTILVIILYLFYLAAPVFIIIELFRQLAGILFS